MGCPCWFGHIPFAPGRWRITRQAERPHWPGVGLSGLTGGPFGAVLADPPWRFQAIWSLGVAPGAPPALPLRHHDVEGDAALPVADVTAPSHVLPLGADALLAEGLRVLEGWGFTYKTMLVWHKVRKDGGSDGRGVGFYFRNVTEPVLFGVRGRLRTGAPARRQVNLFAAPRREHGRKPDELYPVIEACSPGPYLDSSPATRSRVGRGWGAEADPAVVRGRRFQPAERRARAPSGRGSGPGLGPSPVVAGHGAAAVLGAAPAVANPGTPVMVA